MACRLLAASAVLSWFSVETWPAPVPKVMLVAVPPPVAPMVRVSPVETGLSTAAGLGDAAVPRPSAVKSSRVGAGDAEVPLAMPVCSVTTPPATAEAGAGVAAGGIDRREQVGDRRRYADRDRSCWPAVPAEPPAPEL